MIRYLILLTSVVSFSCIAYEPTRYKKLLEQTQLALEQQRALVHTKISLHSKPISVTTLDLSEQDLLDASQKEFVKQLNIRGILIDQRLEKLKERQEELGAISSQAEEERLIQQLSLQQKATYIKDQLDDIILTEVFINREQALQQRLGRNAFGEKMLTALNNKWSAKKAKLTSKLEAIQAG